MQQETQKPAPESETPWLDLMMPNIRKFEVAAAIGGSATWNAEGSKAMAKLLRTMTGIIDEEIIRRAKSRDAAEEERRAGEALARRQMRRLVEEIRKQQGAPAYTDTNMDYRRVQALYRAHRRKTSLRTRLSAALARAFNR